MRHRVKLRIPELVIRPDLDERALIPRAIAIMRCREHRDTAAIVLDFIPLHPDLMRADNSIQTICLAEPLRDIRSKLQTNTPLRWPPPRLRLRIRPQHLHHQPRLPRLPLLKPIQFPNIRQRNIII